MVDVAIIGAGVVGGFIARELSKYELSVCLIEKENDVAMGATKANSAIVHAGFDAKVGTLKAKFNVLGSKMMESVAEELGVKYKNNGSIVVGFDEDDRKVLEELLERGKKNGVEGLIILEKDELKNLEPNISDKVKCALYAPTGAIICPYELTVAAVGNAMDNGAELLRNFKVDSIKKENDAFVISSSAGEVKARYIVNAAGLYSDEIAKLVGDDSFTVKPRRGEYFILDSECGALAKTTIFRTPSKMGKGILVSPTVDGNVILGPTAEDMEDKEDKKVTQKGLNDVKCQASDYISNVPFNKVITTFTGLRAVGSTGDFIIEESKVAKGFINVAGIESPGLTSAPAICGYVAELLENSGLELKKKANFNGKREPHDAFRHMSIEEKNELIKKEPSYGRIVCRCEEVTEGEILAAIRRNPKPLDLDGVKRRTRSGMGRCHGGFCGPNVQGLIAKELSLNYEEVTKFGRNSKVIFEKIR